MPENPTRFRKNGQSPCHNGSLTITRRRTHLKNTFGSRCERFSRIRKARRGSRTLWYCDEVATQRDGKIAATLTGYGQFRTLPRRSSSECHKAHRRRFLHRAKLAYIAAEGTFEMGSMPVAGWREGQSLIEILVAMAIGSLLIIAAASVIVPALNINTQAYKFQTGVGLAKELLENVRVWSEGDWHNVSALATGSANHYYLNTFGSPFTSSLGDEFVMVSTTTYERYFYLDDVYRDAGDLIATGGTITVDPSTKKITVAYSWPQSATLTISEYLTRNRDKIFWQTDWSGGPGQDGPATTSNKKFSTSTNIDYTTSTGSLYIKFP